MSSRLTKGKWSLRALRYITGVICIGGTFAWPGPILVTERTPVDKFRNSLWEGRDVLIFLPIGFRGLGFLHDTKVLVAASEPEPLLPGQSVI